MAIYNREDSRTALPQLEKRIRELEEHGVYVATINKTSYKEVKDALKKGYIVYAMTPNSYGTNNMYIYSNTGTDKICFFRMHYSNAPSCRYAYVNADNTWTTQTVNLATT